MIRRAEAARGIALVVVLTTAGCSDRGAEPRPGASPAGARPADAGPPRGADAAPPASALPHRTFPGPAAALATILELRPRVVGFGEYHELRGSAQVQSTVHRFTTDLLGLLVGRGSDLVVETWVEAGRCGAQERRVSKDVQKVTERPKHTQNELVTLIQRARELGLTPHLLELACDDYRRVLAGDEVDYERLLQLVAAKLRDRALAAHGRREPDRMIALYGGSLHNDLYPVPGVEDFSYAPAVDAATGGGYVEVDLYVPEYIDADPDLAAEPWHPLYRQLAGPDRVVLIERAPRSYILILQRGLARAAPPGAAPAPPGAAPAPPAGGAAAGG